MNSILKPLLLTLCVAVISLFTSAFPQTGYSFTVPDFISQIKDLKHHAEAIGWILHEELGSGTGAPDPDISNHYQGICRYPGPGIPVLYVTQSFKECKDEKRCNGYLLVVRMKSRLTDGERMRSNLLPSSEHTTIKTEPSPEDAWYRSIRFNGNDVKIEGDDEPLAAYNHPGGMYIEDDILFVSMDQKQGDKGQGGEGTIVLFDLYPDIFNPRPIRFLELNHQIDNLAVTRLSNDNYLIWTNGDGGNENRFYEIQFDETSSKNLRDTFELKLIQKWNPDEDDVKWYYGQGAHQGSALIRDEKTGHLYLIGMRKPKKSSGEMKDLVDIYRVERQGDLDGDHLYKLNPVDLDDKQNGTQNSLHLFCGFPPSLIDPTDPTTYNARICSFRGGSNAYVSPTGELILYTIQRDDEDWADSDFARMGEFRHREVNRPDSPLREQLIALPGGPYYVGEGSDVHLSGAGLPNAEPPWVELYDDNGGWYHDFEHPDGLEGDRSIVVDYVDSQNLELDNFHNIDKFDNKTTSVAWRMPVGQDAILYQNSNFEGRRVILRGTGQTEFVSHLGNDEVVIGVIEHENPNKASGDKLDFNDRASSMKFADPPVSDVGVTLEWDLDGDGVFGETGASADRGDEIGATPSFSAVYLDGPTAVSIELKACDVLSNCDQKPTTIHVQNVAPVVSISVEAPNPYFVLPQVHTLTFTGTFTDSGCLDTHTSNWDFGDNSSGPGSLDEENDPPDATGTSIAEHIYDEPGKYNVTLTVTDDDDDFGTDTAEIIVLTAADAIQVLQDYIATLPNEVFAKNADQRKRTLILKLVEVKGKIDAGQYRDASNKLLNDIRTKVDGCLGGLPRNDWIVDCESQAYIGMMIDDLIDYLKLYE